MVLTITMILQCQHDLAASSSYSAEEVVEMEDEALLMVGLLGPGSSGPEALGSSMSMVVIRQTDIAGAYIIISSEKIFAFVIKIHLLLYTALHLEFS